MILLAAGYGKRLGNLTKEYPKGLLEINGKTILDRQISLFQKNGIDDITIITGPHKHFGIENVSYINDEYYAQHDVLGSLMYAKNEKICRVTRKN